VLEGKALYEGPEHTVFTRVAQVDDALYLDLGNPEWEAVKITKTGWKIVSKPRVRFRRPHGLKALPKPVSGGKLDELWDFVNVRAEDRPVVAAWLVGVYQFEAPFPLLVLQGEQGSAKSTTAKLLRHLADPNGSPLRSQPRESRDLMIAAKNGWIVAFDNISSLPVWLSDSLCSLATGGGFSTRALYSDDQEMLFDARRPILLNGIDGVVVRGDLLDRSYVIGLPVITSALRRPEKQLWADFYAAQPRILGALLDAVVGALGNAGKQQNEGDLPRMADFALWAGGSEKALGFEPGTILTALRRNQADTITLPLEASPIVVPLRTVLSAGKGSFVGTATDLFGKLEHRIGQSGKKPKNWPANPRALSEDLRRLAPNLRAAGISVSFGQSDGTGSKKIIRITRQAGKSSDASDASDASQHSSVRRMRLMRSRISHV
jgi:hypothetical protein